MTGPFAVLWEYRETFASGISVTAQLLGIALVLGTLIGSLLAIAARWEPLGLARDGLNALSLVGTAVPAVVILFWVHYPAQALLGVRLPGFVSAAFTLTALNSLAVYRIIIDQVEAFPTQFVTAARVAGLNQSVTLRRIYMPMVIRAILPRWIDQQVFILHCTLLASFISVGETFRVAQRVNASIYKPVLIYSAVGILFLFLAGSALLISNALRRRFDRDWSER